jgi:hypothetical protein
VDLNYVPFLLFVARPLGFDVLPLRTVQGVSESNLPIHKSQSSHSGVGLLGPRHMGSRVTGVWPASDREYTLSIEGFRALDCVESPVDRITIASALLRSKTRRMQDHAVVCGLSDRLQSPW